MIPRRNIPFKTFTSFFPELDLPVILTSESASEFSKFNDPFPMEILKEYFEELDEFDEFTEYVPCLRIPETGDFTALIYYKASLLDYAFYIVSYDKEGNLLTKKPLNRISVDGNKIKNSACIIEDDWNIKIVAGEQNTKDIDYNTDNSKTTSLEILPTGDIVYTLQD